MTWVMRCGLRVTGCGLSVTGCELRVTRCELRVVKNGGGHRAWHVELDDSKPEYLSSFECKASGVSVQDMRLRLPFLTPLAQTWFYMCHADATFFLIDGVGRIKLNSCVKKGGFSISDYKY